MTNEEARACAVQLLQEGKYDEYLSWAEFAIGQYPEDAELWLHYGLAQLPTRPSDAPQAIERAVQLAPTDPWLLTRAGSRLFSLGDFDSAMECARNAFEHAPKDFRFAPDLCHLTGRLALQQGDRVMGEQLLRAAFDAEPDDASFAAILATFLEEDGRPDEAREVIQRGLEHHPDRPELLSIRDRLQTG